MTDIYKCTPEYLIKNAKLPFRVMESEEAMYDEMAEIMADTVKKNGEKRTVIICPVGSDRAVSQVCRDREPREDQLKKLCIYQYGRVSGRRRKSNRL